MRERRRTTIEDLRQTIETLPRATRIAMLEGISSNEIVAGAYSDAGGICPMLAAHRAGGRTNCSSFARAWDRFAFRDARGRLGFRAARTQAARRATARELLVLKTHLEASLLDDDGPAPDLAAAAREHRELLERREQRDDRDRPAERSRPADRPRPGDPDRSRELRSRPGWAWTRIMRTHAEYERVLERLADEHRAIRGRELITRERELDTRGRELTTRERELTTRERELAPR
jgi:hypothetical protein